jgi:uncharacterized protein YwqG
MRDIKSLVDPLIKRAAHLVVVEAPSKSYLGGDPQLPLSTPWPTWEGRRLGFLARVSMSELKQVHPVPWLPNAGALLFFYDMDKQPWGFDPKDRGACAVLHVPDLPLPVDPSTAKTNTSVLPHKSVAFREVATYPSWDRDVIRNLKFSDDEFNAYLDISGAAFAGMSRHQISGFPAAVQSDNMELECQLASNGLYCGDGTGYSDPRAETLSAGAKDWRLLFQMDTDDDLELMWGDCGTVYIWVREQDAKAGNFENPWLILQCA